MTKLTATIRVKNEEKKLPRCLDHLSKYVDAVVALDDNSIDRTYEILKSYDIVKYAVKIPKPYFHEGMDNQTLLSMAQLTNPDWILHIDADEVFEEQMVRHVHTLMEMQKYKIFSFVVCTFVKDQFYDIQPSHWALYRYDPDKVFFWDAPMHFNFPSVDDVAGKWGMTNIRIKHYRDNQKKRIYEFGTGLSPVYKWVEMADLPLKVIETNRSSIMPPNPVERQEYYDRLYAATKNPVPTRKSSEKILKNILFYHDLGLYVESFQDIQYLFGMELSYKQIPSSYSELSRIVDIIVQKIQEIGISRVITLFLSEGFPIKEMFPTILMEL